jgi:hypothetical protein
MPPVSKVFHSCPQEQVQRSSLRGDHPHSGQRMRGPEGLFASSSSRSTTTDDPSRRVVDMLVIMNLPSLQSVVRGSPRGSALSMTLVPLPQRFRFSRNVAGR